MNGTRGFGLAGLVLSIVPVATGLTMEWLQPS